MSLQLTDEWRKARLGKVTGSRLSDVLARTKSGPSASRANYMAELLCERLTGKWEDTYVSPAMQRGTDLEAKARAAYVWTRDAVIEEVGFVPHPMIGMSGASPDGLVGDQGLVEVKVPNTATHIDSLLGGLIPGKYLAQMQWAMACCPERLWCDFVSFDDRLPEAMQLHVVRVARDQAWITAATVEVIAFLDELEAKEKALWKKYVEGAKI